MTAPSRLLGLRNESFGRPTKSLQDAVSASLNLSTSYQPLITWTGGVEAANGGQWLDIGNAPGVDCMFAFTHSTGSILSVIAVLTQPAGGDASVDPTIGAPAPYIPADVDGVNVAYVTELTFDKANWTTTTSPLSSATVKYVRGYLKANGRRLLAIYVKSDANAGSVIGYVSPGTTE